MSFGLRYAYPSSTFSNSFCVFKARLEEASKHEIAGIGLVVPTSLLRPSDEDYCWLRKRSTVKENSTEIAVYVYVLT